MSDQEPQMPKIDFPCQYPVKVMGIANDEFRAHVRAVFDEHAAGFTEADITVRPSAGNKYEAHTYMITATGEPQLVAIFEALKANANVRMVL